MDKLQHSRIFMHALSLYEHNTHKDIIIKDILGEGHVDHYYEKYIDLLINTGLFVVFGKLDSNNRNRLVQIVIDRYWDESERAIRNSD